MATLLDINPDLDAPAYAKAYARDGVVRIANVLAPASAEAVARLLERETAWRLTLSAADNPKPDLYDAAQIQALGQQALAGRLAVLAAEASAGFAYAYLSYPMIRAYIEGWDRGHPIHGLTEFLNSPPFLDLFRTVTGRPDVLKADAQATLYRPGDFLALHDDGAADESNSDRVCAYTFGFTRAWRPDWGGQLLFHDQEGEIERGFAPAFNTLTLFQVPRPHSVAPVAPYAGAPRLSVVGWTRTDRPKSGN